MKKNIFSILTLTLCSALFVITCNKEPSYGDKDDYSVDVLYSTDWRYVSIYLDNKDAPIGINYSKNNRNTRAMTADTARRGFDYFEVFFYYKGTVARSAWEIGKRASIMDVYRTSSGVDYSVTSLRGGTAGGVAGSAPAGSSAVGVVTEGIPTSAASILFAGRKNDKTLLALGKLVSVDAEEPVENPQSRNTLINNGTVFVTFELSSFTANTSADITESSFFTDNTGGNRPAAENTKVINARIGDRDFPLYVLPGGKPAIKAQYNLGIDGKWSDFGGSVFVMKDGKTDKRQARYPAGGGKYYYAKYAEDQTTLVDMTNNKSSWIKNPKADPVELQNPITFIIDTSKTVSPVLSDNGIFSFSFSIPVYAISPAIPKNQDDCWYIRTAYQSYYYNIDNGVTDGEFSDKNIGGAVLCAVDLQPVNYEIPAERR